MECSTKALPLSKIPGISQLTRNPKLPLAKNRGSFSQPPERFKMSDITVKQFQQFIKDKYYEIDSQRGSAKTFLWFIEEVGELATALAGDDQENKIEEFADVLAWLCTLANINNVDLAEAIKKHTEGDIEGYK